MKYVVVMGGYLTVHLLITENTMVWPPNWLQVVKLV